MPKDCILKIESNGIGGSILCIMLMNTNGRIVYNKLYGLKEKERFCVEATRVHGILYEDVEDLAQIGQTDLEQIRELIDNRLGTIYVCSKKFYKKTLKEIGCLVNSDKLMDARELTELKEKEANGTEIAKDRTYGQSLRILEMLQKDLCELIEESISLNF